MTSVINRVYKSRNSIRKIYQDYEWDTSTIPDLRPQDLEAMFNVYSTSEPELTAMGDGMVFTLRLPHRFIQNHNLVVLYYNLSNNGSKSSKTTKSIVDKINALYQSNYLQHDDSLLILVNEPQSPSLDKINHMIQHSIRKEYTLSPELDNYIYKLDSKSDMQRYNPSMFRQCVLLSLDMYQINVLQHELVPKHEIIYDKREIKQIQSKLNVTDTQMPVIHKSDIIAKIIRLNVGDVCQIVRHSTKCGESMYYRICR
jgi:DNA-directed RNA polymerase subunit H (RpoH/RPB5)